MIIKLPILIVQEVILNQLMKIIVIVKTILQLPIEIEYNFNLFFIHMK